jgi:uncharacterized membrane protein YfcA
MLEPIDVIVALAFSAIAFLYAAVGHGGGSGYLAVLTLLDLPFTVVRPAALATNLVVASIAWWRFRRVGSFDRALLWPLAAGSIPAAAASQVARNFRETLSLSVVFGQFSVLVVIFAALVAGLPAGGSIEGPAIVEDAESTTVVHPTQSARVDHAGNLLVAVGS